MSATLRPPAVAGQFYPFDGAELTRLVERCFTDPRGPGELPVRRRAPTRGLQAAVVPHAGLEYSGAIAAHVYGLVAAQRPPATVVILGVDHHAARPWPAVSARAWATPLGPVPCDEAMARRLSRGPIRIDEAAHRDEHSIEVQLPFLDYVLPHPQFVAVQVPFGPYASLERVGAAVAEAVAGHDVLLLASTDFSHYVPAETARRSDGLAIDAIRSGDPRRLYDTVVTNDISMCGIAPTTALLVAVGGRTLVPRVLRWGHSGEIASMRDVVGYAAIALEESGPAAPVK